jgi:hypothetical protein
MHCHPAGALGADAKTIFGAVLLCIAASARADAARKPQQGDYSTDGVTVAGGRMIPELMFHYRTLDMPTQDEMGLITKAILLLRGAAPGAPDLLADDSADILFASGQSFGASQYFLIFPEPIDALSEPGELVQMQYRLVLEHLGMIHLRLILGKWGERPVAAGQPRSACRGTGGRSGEHRRNI